MDINRKNLTSEAGGGKLRSSSKPIGKNGGTIKAEDMPEIKDIGGKAVYAKPGTMVTRIHSFAGKGTKKALRKETELLKIGGEKVNGNIPREM